MTGSPAPAALTPNASIFTLDPLLAESGMARPSYIGKGRPNFGSFI